MKLDFHSTDKIMICGMNKTGKTVFAKHLIKQFPSYVIFDVLWEYSDCGAIYSRIDDKILKTIPKIVVQSQTSSEVELENICDLLWNSGNKVLVIEELHKFATTQYIPKNLNALTNLGRHKGIGIIGISPRIARVNKDFVGLCEHIIAYKLFLPNDIDYIRDFAGDNAYQIRNLPDYHFFYYHKGVSKICSPVPK